MGMQSAGSIVRGRTVHLPAREPRIHYLSRNMTTEQHRSNPLALALALAAFTVCFFAWSMFGPLGPTLQSHLHLSEFELAFVVAIPVVLGSLMRIPVGILTDRLGGRLVFTALMTYSVVPLVLLALFHDSFGAVVALGFLLGVTGASFAVGVPYVNRWYDKSRQGFALGVYGMGMGGTVIAALTAPKMAKQWSLATPFWVAAGLMAVMAAVFWLVARDAPAVAAPTDQSPSASLAVFRRSVRAWALTLFYFLSLRRLRRHVPVSPKAAHRRSPPDEDRRRLPRGRIRVPGGAGPAGRGRSL
jgi:MFS transporter, NNP family, nitrate/nitrite transporter